MWGEKIYRMEESTSRNSIYCIKDETRVYMVTIHDTKHIIHSHIKISHIIMHTSSETITPVQ